MRLALISDVHIDSHPWNWSLMDGCPSDVRTVVLAGDISDMVWQASNWLVELKSRFENVIWVAGNHDFYNVGAATHDYSLDHPNWPYPRTAQDTLDHYARWSVHHGIEFLHRRSVVIEDVTFIGATGWHDYIGGEPYTTEQQIQSWYDHMPDTAIKWNPFLIKPDHLAPYDAGVKDAVSITDMVSKANGKVMVVTHHVPHRSLLVQRPESDIWTRLHGSFVNTALERILDPRIKVWAYGHTHFRGMAEMGSATYVCNARGGRNQNPGWTPIIIEV